MWGFFIYLRFPIMKRSLFLIIFLLPLWVFAQHDSLSHTVNYLDGDPEHVDTIHDIGDYDDLQSFGYKKRPYLYLSNIGRPEYHLELQLPTKAYATLGPRSFLDQHHSIYEIPFFSVKSPLSEITYYSTINRGQQFGGYFTQNINPNLSYFLQYKRLRSLGDYFRQESVMDETKLSLRYTSPNKRYGLVAGLAWDVSRSEENGGIVYDSAYADNTVNFRALMDVNLGNSRVKARTTTAFVEQDFVFVKTDTSGTGNGISFYHRAEFQDQYFAFISQDSNYISTGIDTTIARDSSGTTRFSNVLGIKGKFNKKGLYFLFKTGAYYHALQYNTKSSDLSEGSFGIEAVVNGDYKKWLLFNANFQMGLIEQYAGNFVFNISANFGSWFWGNFHLSNRSPDYLYRSYSGNTVQWSNNDFESVVTQAYKVGAGYKNYFKPYIGAKSISNYLYFTSESSPLQAQTAITTFEAGALIDIPLSTHWFIDGEINYQKIAEGEQYIGLPELYGRGRIYNDFKLFEKALHAQIGAEYQYVDRFRGMNYLPSLGVFSATSDGDLGESHILNLFLNIRIQTAQVFFKYENALEGLIPYSNLGAPHYPMTDAVFRFGFKWRFFN